jgi:hypothetical protein
MAGRPGEHYLLYFGREAPRAWPFVLYREGLADGAEFRVEIVDTWDMTITPVDGSFSVKRKDAYTFVDREGRAVPLPGRPGIALRIRRSGGQRLQAAPPVLVEP